MLPIILATIPDEKTRHKAELLYEKYIGLMIHVARKMVGDPNLAEDIVSESVVKLLRYIDKIDSLACYQQRQYIVYIVKSTCIDYYRKTGKDKVDTVDDWDTSIMSAEDNSLNPLDDLVSKEGYESLVTAILNLPDTLKEVTYLHLVHGHDHNEIAALLGISYDNSKMRLSRAKKIIKESIQTRLAGE